MADKRVTQLAALASTTSDDLLLVVDNPNGTPVSKKITVKNLFGAVPCNTAISGRMTLTGNTTIRCSNTTLTSNVNVTGKTIVNTFALTLKANPSSNNAATNSKYLGELWCSNTYLYVVVNNTTIKRIALSTF